MPAIRSILSLPLVYRTFINLVGGVRCTKILLEEYVRPNPGARILDIGCGPGTIVPYFPNVQYTGFDMSSAYIESARRRFPEATFICERISRYALPQRSYYDVVLALGILHHLDDEEAQQLFDIAHQALKAGGKLVTLDGVFVREQSALARYVISRDRGEFVRDEEAYVQIASQSFSNVKPNVRHDLLRIPYTHIIMECLR
jgi:cyclopropane fatty-acyl-phospholipid synthase-like methyltransferase